MKVCILFGGSGYIGSKIIERFLEKKYFDKIIQVDIKDPTIPFNDVVYVKGDVRKDLKDIVKLPESFDKQSSWIFNLAAIHREPGHKQHEYFDTNIKGAENVARFAEETGIKNIFFTSSIAPYGRSLEQRTESSMLYSETPYGISKGYAEKIHQLWQVKEDDKKLVICRPSVIYGPGDPGNVLRMIKGIKSGTFFFPVILILLKGMGIFMV
jgi:nucleoside-diphosphate-sugar epimerase